MRRLSEDKMMKHFARGLAALSASAVIAGTALMDVPAQAKEYSLGTLKIDTPWTRATPGGAKMGGGYTTITNTGSEPDRLVSASTDASARVEIHEMGMTEGVMKMRELEGGLEIPPGETVSLEPGGFHVMFMGLNAPLKQGEAIEVTLQFEKAGEIAVMMPIAAVGAKTPDGKGGMDHSDHDHSGHDHNH
ncbi:MAG: copper chaperone PCu(A)C [Pseudomonadota bacterium]